VGKNKEDGEWEEKKEQKEKEADDQVFVQLRVSK